MNKVIKLLNKSYDIYVLSDILDQWNRLITEKGLKVVVYNGKNLNHDSKLTSSSINTLFNGQTLYINPDGFSITVITKPYGSEDLEKLKYEVEDMLNYFDIQNINITNHIIILCPILGYYFKRQMAIISITEQRMIEYYLYRNNTKTAFSDKYLLDDVCHVYRSGYLITDEGFRLIFGSNNGCYPYDEYTLCELHFELEGFKNMLKSFDLSETFMNNIRVLGKYLIDGINVTKSDLIKVLRGFIINTYAGGRGNYQIQKSKLDDLNQYINELLSCHEINKVKLAEVTDYGNEFKRLRHGKFFIDKTLFITEVVTNRDTIILSYMKHMGKTILMNMLYCFFDCFYSKKNPWLFCGTKLYNLHRKTYDSYKGMYPVLKFQLSKIKVFESEREITKALGEVMLSAICKDHVYLLSKLREGRYGKALEYLKAAENDATARAIYETYTNDLIDLYHGNLDYLCKMIGWIIKTLSDHYSKKVLIIFDDYDFIINKYLLKYLNNPSEVTLTAFYKMSKLFNQFYSEIKNENSNLFKLILCGDFDVLPKYGKYGIEHSRIFNMASVRLFPHFGITDSEIDELLIVNKLENNVIKENLSAWYNGYIVNSNGQLISIYNMQSCINYLTNLVNPKYDGLTPNPFDKYKTTVLYDYSQTIRESVMNKKLLDLLNNQSISIPIKEKIVDSEPSLILHDLLWQSGFIIKTNCDNKEPTYILPNLEIRDSLFNLIINTLKLDEYAFSCQIPFHDFFKGLIYCNKESLEKTLETFLKVIPSNIWLKEERDYQKLLFPFSIPSTKLIISG
jgi:hypothetical protein